MEFQEGFSVYGVQLELAAQHNREMNGKFEVIWKTLQPIAH